MELSRVESGTLDLPACLVCLNSSAYRAGLRRGESAETVHLMLPTTFSPIFLILFLPRSGFGVYSIDRHVSIEKYNILWFKGIPALIRERGFAAFYSRAGTLGFRKR
jgi:hypothetical protein